MTTTLSESILNRHPHLEHRERHALTTLGIDLTQRGILLELQWDTSWLSVDNAPGSTVPVQWFITYHVVERVQQNYGLAALEYGPDYDERSTEQEASGLLTDLAAKLKEILEMDCLDADQSVRVEINGWALHVAGLLS